MLLATLLSGCAYDQGWVKERDVSVSRIRKVESVTGCAAGQIACSSWIGGECTIYVPSNAPELIGHEAAHCFGWAHGEH